MIAQLLRCLFGLCMECGHRRKHHGVTSGLGCVKCDGFMAHAHTYR